MSSNPQSRKKIDGYLEKLNIKPSKIIEEDTSLTYVIQVELDFGRIDLDIRFKIEDPKWVEFKALFLNNVRASEKTYEKLLELNYKTLLTKFCLEGNDIYAKIELPFPTMDYDEFFSAIRRIANDVNNYYPKFSESVTLQ